MPPIARALTSPTSPFATSRDARPPRPAPFAALPSDADAPPAPGRAGGAAAGPASDGELVRAGRLGDEGALGELFRRHRRSALAVARRQLRSPSDVDDAVAEAFTRSFERLSTLRSPERFRAFLLAIVRSVASDRRRAAARSHPDGQLEHRPAAGDVEAAVLSGEASRSLLTAVERLPARQRYAVRRFYWDEVPVADLARELGVSVNAATQLLFRARAGLALQSTVTCRRARRRR
jgi:RNA polymerase sigma factor (sigma-70 family)